MTREEFRTAALDTAYLAACAVNGETPDAARVAAMDLAALYQAADRHLLTGITAMALEKAGVHDAAFTQAKGKAIRKVAAFDIERAAVLDAGVAGGIWYLPLMGCVLKTLYPAIGMRQMSDNDILYDTSRTEDAAAVMEGLGFTRAIGSIHDHYTKEPVCNFELHHTLFGEGHDERLRRYYADVERRMLPDEGKRFGYHLSDEDFYLYILAHEYRHFSTSGTGLRSLLDTYVYLKRKGDGLDRAYIDAELDKLGIADFEKANRELALRLFSGEALRGDDAAMLDYVIFSGVYGTETNRLKNQVRKKGRVGYLLSRAFLPYRLMRNSYPILGPLPFLLPLFWVFRWLQALCVKPKRVLSQLRAAFRSPEEKKKGGAP